jgi:mannose-6-phosphate isomerase-like protein (cupin superfamily)
VSDQTTTSRDARAREFVLDRQTRARILTTAAETDGRHDLTDCEQTAGATTPLHLHTRYQERFWVVSGSLTVWPPPPTSPPRRPSWTPSCSWP